jgi:hypothetical protein
VPCTLWPYRVDTYELYQVVSNNPRLKKKDISQAFHVNEKTGAHWWSEALSRGIIRPPIFRRKSFSNFREYFYFLNVEDPHELFVNLHEKRGLMFFSVQSGFSNVQVVSQKKMNFSDVVISGERSDYFVTTPCKCSFDDAVQVMLKKVGSIADLDVGPSPLVYHDDDFVWDENDEKIYGELCNDFRKPFREVLRNTGTYSDKLLRWIRNRDQFGQTIVMYFPEGLGAYQPTTFLVETEYDSLLIEIFSCLPVPTVFYRIGAVVLFNVFLPFSLGGEVPYRSVPYVVLNELRKKKLVLKYTNSIDQYYYRPQF